MTTKNFAWAAVTSIALIVAFFEVSLNFEFQLAGESRQPDTEQEARYMACYAERDVEIHRIAFGTIDNPDVQKEYITANRGRASSECRAAFPQRNVTIATPFCVNLLDFTPRFW